MTNPLSDKQIDQLIADYLSGELSDQDHPVFEAWLRASPDHPRRVAQLAATDFALREVCQDTKADYLLDVLNQIDETSGPTELVTLHHLKTPRHGFKLFAIAGAIAAALVLAVSLTFVLSGNSNTGSIATYPIESVDPREPGSNGPVLTQPTVATLTAERDAVWDRKPREHLRAGERLTLTQGFAEITTNRGAIAILEAPATIELLDNDNALRLHTGKLVGICETESSKGFVVRTPHMDITDLGTRFGIDVSNQDSTEAHVFSGSVEVQSNQNTVGDMPGRQMVFAGQAIRIEQGADQFVQVAPRVDRFAFTDEIVISLPGTGFGVEKKTRDPNWKIVAYQGKRLAEPMIPLVQGSEFGTDGEPNSRHTSQWLYWTDTHYSEDLSETYLFETRLRMPDTIDPATARISLDCAADNRLTAIIVNGTRQPVRPVEEFNSSTYQITQGLVAGLNTIGFEVVNTWKQRNVGSHGNGIGLRVSWELRGQARSTRFKHDE